MTSTEQRDTDQQTDPRLEEVLAWLGSLEPVVRARYLAVLLDGRNRARLSDVRVAAVYAATRKATHAVVAAGIGVSASAVNHAVTAYLKAHPAGD